MLKCIKTVISLLLICVLLPTSFVSAENTGLDQTASQKAIEVLKALDIVEKEADIDIDEDLTRAEFAIMLCSALGMDNSVGIEQTVTFIDVASDHKAAGAISIMNSLGVVNGFENGKFYPDEPIISEHAIKMAARALGYDIIADRKGGAMADYIAVAAQAGMLSKVSWKMGEPLSYGAGVQLLYNSLFVDLVGQTSYGENPIFEIQKGSTLLYEKFNTVKITGKIMATEQTSLIKSEGAGKGRVTIGDKTYLSEVMGADEWLGYEAECYVRYYDGFGELGTVIYIAPDVERSDVITIEAENIRTGTTDDKIKYYEMPSFKEKEANIKNAYVIYNGKTVKNYNDADFMPKSGSVTLIDTDGNGRYDVVNIISYDICVIETISNSKIDFRYGKADIPIDLSSNNVEYIFIKNGEEISYSDINDWDVCAVKKTKDNKRYEFYISSEKVSGMVKQMTEDSIQIGEVEYKLGKNYKDALADPMISITEPTLGADFTFALDIFGHIAGSHKEMTPMLGDEGYGYLLKAQQTKKPFEMEMSFKILTSTVGRVIKVFPAAENIKLNGSPLEDIASEPVLFDSTTQKVIPQLIIYELNENGEIKALYTAKDKHNATLANGAPNPDYDSNYVGYTEDEFTLDFYFAQGAYSPGNVRTFRASKWGIDQSTVMFTVPNGQDPKEETCLVTYTGIKLNANSYHYNMYFYDTTPDYNVPIIVRKVGVDTASGIDSVADTSPVMLVDKTILSLNSDGVAVPKIYGYVGGEYVGYSVYNDEVKDAGGVWNASFYGMTPSDLKQGDVIQYVLNNENDMVAFRVLHVNTSNLSYFEKSTSSISMSEASGALYTAYGTVVKRTKDGLVYNANGVAANRNWDRKIFLDDSKAVYIYHSDKNKIEKATAKEINTGDTLLLQKNTYNLGMVVIYR